MWGTLGDLLTKITAWKGGKLKNNITLEKPNLETLPNQVIKLSVISEKSLMACTLKAMCWEWCFTSVVFLSKTHDENINQTKMEGHSTKPVGIPQHRQGHPAGGGQSWNQLFYWGGFSWRKSLGSEVHSPQGVWAHRQPERVTFWHSLPVSAISKALSPVRALGRGPFPHRPARPLPWRGS